MSKRTYTIGVLAPSLPSEGKREGKVRAAVQYLESLGNTVLVSEGTYAVNGYKSGGARQRATELLSFLRDPRVDMIIATTGGYNSNEILEFLELTTLTQTEKVFVGYSDCTALSMALERYKVCRTVCGPMLVDYVDFPECFERLFAALERSAQELTNERESWESVEAGRFPMPRMERLGNKAATSEGRALAANISTLCLMMGTPYLPSFSGRVLFLEYDREEQRALPSLERFMWQLRQGGMLRELSGLVFGALQPSVAAEETETDSLKRILTEVTEGYEFPVIYNAQFGHIYPSWVIVNGASVTVRGTTLAIVE